MLNPATFTRLSPEDEDVHAHISIDMSTIGFVGIFVPSLLLTATALVRMNDTIMPWEGNNDTKTQFLIENMEELRNGSYYYKYMNSESGIIDSGVIDSWYSHIIEGQYRYDFGTSYDNFCWNRDEIPEEEWLPSLYRSSQLFAGVQVPIRIALLISITHRLFLLYAAIRCKTVMGASTVANSAAPYLLMNEFLLLTSMYLYYSIHISQDERIVYVIPITASTMLVTFAVKMFTGNMLHLEEGNGICVARIAFGFMTGCVASNVFRNTQHSSTSMNCDQWATSMTAVCEYIFLVMVFMSYVLDIVNTSSMRLMVSCSAQDAADYGKVTSKAIGAPA